MRVPQKVNRHQREDLIHTAEVARILGKDVTTVNRWAKAGRLPVAVKIPGRTGANLFARADVEALRESSAA